MPSPRTRRPQSKKAQPGNEKASAFPAALRDNYRQGGHAWITRPCRGMRTRREAAQCRAMCGDLQSGFSNLRSALPMNLRAHYPHFKVWAGVQADIDRVTAIWRECLATYGGPFLFGEKPTMADAMYAPVATRLLTYDVKLDSDCAAYC